MVRKTGKGLQGQMRLFPFCLQGSWHGHSFLMIRAESLIHELMIRPDAWNTLSIFCVHTHIHMHEYIYIFLIYLRLHTHGLVRVDR